MTRVTCRLTDKNRDWLRNPTLDGLSCRKSNSHLRSGRDTDKTVLSCLAWRCELPLRRSRNNPAGYVAAAVAINTNLSLLTPQLWAYYNCDTSTIRVRFDYDSTTIRLQHATTRYEVFVRSHTRSYTRISGRRVLHVD